MDNTKDITVLSLCAGYGGLELGLSKALEAFFRVVAVEVEAYALANLVSKAEEGKLAIEALWPDVKTFPAEKFRDCFDILTAGYPCQPFSVAGKRKGTDDPRHLWPHIARIVQAVRPVRCFFENVGGHLSIGFPEVYRSLRLMGYKVEAGLFTAAECNLSMEEGTRLFILAQAEGINGSILLRSGKPQQTNTDTGRPGEMVEPPSRGRYEYEKKEVCTRGNGIINTSFVLGEANSQGLQRMRPAESRRRNEFAPDGVAVDQLDCVQPSKACQTM